MSINFLILWNHEDEGFVVINRCKRIFINIHFTDLLFISCTHYPNSIRTASLSCPMLFAMQEKSLYNKVGILNSKDNRSYSTRYDARNDSFSCKPRIPRVYFKNSPNISWSSCSRENFNWELIYDYVHVRGTTGTQDAPGRGLDRAWRVDC